MSCSVGEDGQLVFRDESGALVDEHLVELAKKQHKDGLLGLIQSKCDDINAEVESVATVHLETPNCNQVPRFEMPAFDVPAPTMPAALKLGLLDKLFKKRRLRAEENHRQKVDAFNADTQKWQEKREKFHQAAGVRREFIEKHIYVDTTAMEQWLEEVLADIGWPRETEVAFEVLDGGATVMLDVDLPEVEGMPNKVATVPSRGLKLSVKGMSATKVQKLYMEHVHAVIFRLIGEVFAALPIATTVIASGYSQRHSGATGRLQDEYLLSVVVPREVWSHNDFDHLDQIEVTESLARFELRRTMSKTGVFKAIEPFRSPPPH
ncbi:DUF4236 domain-containing protein [Cupriavidus sp. 2SB]|uniref:DUF4236 domain-containing protein n=1 Tax=Cupriavidus sp. 2SB TaxID=2502199 RepID=UPI002017FCE8|nr:DUF4236 domain-containing protein [Cupriavidus sp. 2SB]